MVSLGSHKSALPRALLHHRSPHIKCNQSITQSVVFCVESTHSVSLALNISMEIDNCATLHIFNCSDIQMTIASNEVWCRFCVCVCLCGGPLNSMCVDIYRYIQTMQTFILSEWHTEPMNSIVAISFTNGNGQQIVYYSSWFPYWIRRQVNCVLDANGYSYRGSLYRYFEHF